MDDDRVWTFETSLWTEGRDNYHEKVDPEVVMVLPTPPYVFQGQGAIEAVSATPEWKRAELTERRVSRPEEGHIVVAYHADVSRDGERYVAWCTSTYRRLAHDVWRVVQHQQTPPLAAGGGTAEKH